MKYIKFLLIGVLFGITLSKAEVISWFRIYEMFKFQSFHMYGVIGSAVVIGMVLMYLYKKETLKSNKGEVIKIAPKKKGVSRNLIGGIIFGLGWALGGVCPGPMYVLMGQGVVAILVVLFGAHLGTFLYHAVKHKLPH
ncbi:MAG: YeeE/YedE family protein [Flavobacteriaceae bacterium]|nr:YeeE/YedE family protein [Flavobacteriaceae bacterium]